MRDVFICDAVRTPDRPIRRVARKGARRRPGGCSHQGADARHPKLDWSAVDEVYFGCANQAGEDNRNVAMAIEKLN
jgi:3-oxoadipyl-CoA thiolase